MNCIRAAGQSIMMVIMVKIRRVVLAAALFLLLAVSAVSNVMAQTETVDVITIKGTINPVLVDYVQDGIQKAEETGAQALIIQMDTPGGLDSAMREIIQSMINARVPVVVYVAPSGARAASAGTYILMASHVAAMAPNTVIGAAHPVSIGGGESGTPAVPPLTSGPWRLPTDATPTGRRAPCGRAFPPPRPRPWK